MFFLQPMTLIRRAFMFNDSYFSFATNNKYMSDDFSKQSHRRWNRPKYWIDEIVFDIWIHLKWENNRDETWKQLQNDKKKKHLNHFVAYDFGVCVFSFSFSFVFVLFESRFIMPETIGVLLFKLRGGFDFSKSMKIKYCLQTKTFQL